MAKRSSSDNQPSLFDNPEPTRSAQPCSLRQLYIEQVIRDSAVLREDPEFHVPSRQFFEDRIQLFRDAIKELDGSGGSQ